MQQSSKLAQIQKAIHEISDSREQLIGIFSPF
jgi:hypothetical protein